MHTAMKMKNSKTLDNTAGVLCALGGETLFGLSIIFTKQVTEYADALSLLGWRFLIAFVVMSLCLLLGLIKIDLRGKSLKPLLLVALWSPCIYYISETVGVMYTTASESAVFFACIPVVSLVASTLLLKEKPSKTQAAGILITFAGILVTVFAVSAASSLSVPGYAFLLIAVVSYSLYTVFVSKAHGYTGAEVTYMMLLAGALLFVILAIVRAALRGSAAELIALPFNAPGFLAAVLYQGIGCSVLAFFLSNVAISKIGVNRTASFIGFSTVVSILAGALLPHTRSLFRGAPAPRFAASGLFDHRLIIAAKAFQRSEDRQHILSKLRQAVFHSGRILMIVVPIRKPVIDHLPQAFGQNLLGDPIDASLQLIKSPRALSQVPQKQKLPLSANQGNRSGNRAFRKFVFCTHIVHLRLLQSL